MRKDGETQIFSQGMYRSISRLKSKKTFEGMQHSIQKVSNEMEMIDQISILQYQLLYAILIVYHA